MNSLRSKSWLLLSCVLALIATACGNRLSRDEILAQNVVRDVGSGSVNASSGQSASNAAGDVGSGGGGDTAAATGGVGGGDTAAATGGAGPDTGAVAGQGPTGNKAPIVIGLIGQLSGLGGSTLGPARDAWVAWERSVNARGGINGHPVKLLVGDDGGNASLSISIARDFVENQGAIALTSIIGSGMPIADYAKSKRIAVIGTINASADWLQNPMLFSEAPAPEAISWGSARLIKAAGLTKVAYMYCAESADCKSGLDKFKRYAPEEGLDLVYSGQFSVTAPDYTAECLQMQSAHAEAVVPVGDNASLTRMAQSCGRQGFRPVWVAATANDGMTKIPEFDGAIGVTAAFPWFLRSDSPAIAEYADALQKYAPDRLTDGLSYQSWAWQAAKIFEMAAANVSDQPTNEDILNGLWAMQGETLGGLAPGPMARTFTRDQPTPEVYCVFDSRIQGGSWVAPQGLTPVCR